jgi:tetratricopeptide (TPR) repeat protein
MPQDELISTHAAALDDGLRQWLSEEARTEPGIPADEAAAALLEHAGMLDRYTGTQEGLALLERLSVAQRTALLEAACRHLEQVPLAEQCRRLLRADVLSVEELEALEQAVVRRDALEAALAAARRLARTLPEAARRPLTPPLARAAANLASFDLALRSRRDVASVVWRAVESLASRIRTPSARQAWWFDEARRLDSAFDSLEIARPAFPTVPPLDPLRDPALDRMPFVAPVSPVRPAGPPAVFSSEARPQQAIAALWGPSAKASRPVELVAPGLTGMVVECVWLPDDQVQFTFKDEAIPIVSFSAEGHQIAVFDGDREVARATVQLGVAKLAVPARFTSCEVFNRAGQSLGKLQSRG